MPIGKSSIPQIAESAVPFHVHLPLEPIMCYMVLMSPHSLSARYGVTASAGPSQLQDSRSPSIRKSERQVLTMLFCLLCLSSALNCGSASAPAASQVDDWPYYGHDAGGMRYSPLVQINRENVP